MTNEIKIEAGKRYVMRSGLVTKRLLWRGGDFVRHPWTDGCDVWTDNGGFWPNGRASSLDIIREATPEEIAKADGETAVEYRVEWWGGRVMAWCTYSLRFDSIDAATEYSIGKFDANSIFRIVRCHPYPAMKVEQPPKRAVPCEEPTK